MSNSDKFEFYLGKKLRRKVRAIVTDGQGEFLLIQPQSYKDNMWSFVGGGVEEGESLEQAMKRELREEVGIDHILSMVSSKDRPWYEFSQKSKKEEK